MQDKKITHINTGALSERNINRLCNTLKGQPNKIKKLSFNVDGYQDLSCKINAILSAIKIISNTSEDNGGVVYSLAEIAENLIPKEEMQFLDELLNETGFESNNFVEVKKLLK